MRSIWIEATKCRAHWKRLECGHSDRVHGLRARFQRHSRQALTIKDKRLAIQMILVDKDISISALKTLPTYQIVADGLTEARAPAGLLRKTRKEGKMILTEPDTIKEWAKTFMDKFRVGRLTRRGI